MPDPFAILPLLHDAQAGGGGSFGGGHGGGGFGGGGGGGGDGGAVYLVFWLVRLTVAYPLVGVPLWIVGLLVLAAGARRGYWGHQARTIRRARPLRESRARRASTAVLSASDPDFDEPSFLARVRVAFEKAQSAWCRQDLEPLRPFVSDGVFERFSLQIDEQREDGWRQGMEGLRLEPLVVVHAGSGGPFETITVRVPFRADIHRLALDTGRKIAGSTIPRNLFVECWTFVRRRGTRTRVGAGLIEGQCPSCGAELAMNQSAKCASCGVLVRSGAFDWVLTEITQESEWRPEDERSIPGWSAQAGRDPELSAALLEDRASVAFWRLAASDRQGSADPLRRIAEEVFCEQRAAELAEAPGGPRAYLADRAVGSVRTLGLLADDEHQRAVVEVVWDGRFARVGEDGRRKLDDRRLLRRTLLVLARPAGERTRADEGFSSAMCPTCGAYDGGGTEPDCPYCGTPRTGGRGTWLLTAAVGAASQEARSLAAEIAALSAEPLRPAGLDPSASRSFPQARQPGTGLDAEPAPVLPAPGPLVTWAAALAAADGAVSGRERRAVESLAQRAGLSPSRAAALLELDGTDELPAPAHPAEARAWFAELVTIALADGTLSRDETRLLQRAANQLGLDRRELPRAVARARTHLYTVSHTVRN